MGEGGRGGVEEKGKKLENTKTLKAYFSNTSAFQFLNSRT